MAFKVRAMYAFSGEPGTAELTIYEQEILTVTRTDVGEGWWEGTNSRGQSGLFPETYVERMEDAPLPPPPPASPLPPLPQVPVTAQPPQHRYERTPDEWEPPGAEGDAWDDDWDDDTYSDIGPATNANNQPQRNSQIYANTSEIQSYQGDDTMSVTSSVPGGAPRRNINRFASFAKSGGESYILGTLNTQGIADNELCRITTVGDSFSWAPITEPYTVIVASPKKESKFKGIKSFMAYQLTPSFNKIQVSRRYKHFDWLHERLVEKFCLIPVPPLPDKQISGRYEEHFIEQRRAQLQEFVDWVCRHPILSRCRVWTHFLTCTDEKMWKLGKREAEKDKLVGLNSCAAVSAPDKTLLASVVELQTETCSNYVHQMDTAVKTLMATCADQTKKCKNIYKQEYQCIGSAFYTFGNALALDEGYAASTATLTAASREIGTAYIEIGKYFEEQPKHDWYPMSHKLHIHRGILGGFPSILNMHKEAMTKKKECEKLSGENKMEPAQLGEVKRRTEVVSYALLAEISHVRSERDSHIKETLKCHIQEQIQFYQRIVDRLVAAQKKLEE